MPVITFKNYKIMKISYYRKDRALTEGKIKYKPNFSCNIHVDSEKKSACVDLETKFDNGFPFFLQVCIDGSFTYNIEEDSESKGFEFFLQTNAVAILYPYLRAIVSGITSSTNEFSALILPTINVAEFLAKNGNKK